MGLELKTKIGQFLENDNCIIILDTNVYLNLYEYSPEVSDFFIEITDLILDKIYLPNTVKREFDRNHHTCFGRQKKKFENVPNLLKKSTDQMKDKIKKQFSVLKNLKFPDIDDLEDKVEKQITFIEEIFEEYVEEHDAIDEINRKFLDKDKIQGLISRLSNQDSLLEGFNVDEIYMLCEEGEKGIKKIRHLGMKIKRINRVYKCTMILLYGKK